MSLPGAIISARMAPQPTVELGVLEEKLRALATLMRYERDLEKLKFYKREFDLLTAELRGAEVGSKKKRGKVLAFTPKKPSAPPDYPDSLHQSPSVDPALNQAYVGREIGKINTPHFLAAEPPARPQRPQESHHAERHRQNTAEDRYNRNANS